VSRAKKNASLGGAARARSMSKEARSAAARKAALARWAKPKLEPKPRHLPAHELTALAAWMVDDGSAEARVARDVFHDDARLLTIVTDQYEAKLRLHAAHLDSEVLTIFRHAIGRLLLRERALVLEAVLRKIHGRREMNAHTAAIHPDPQVRLVASLRAQAYALVADDVSR
jgi:hypothetical protein